MEQDVRGVESRGVRGEGEWLDGLNLILERNDVGKGGHKDHEGHKEGSGCVANRISVFDYDDEDIGEGSGGSNEQLSDNVWAPPVFEDSVEEEEEYDAHSETSFTDLKVVENDPDTPIVSSINEESMTHLPSEEKSVEVGRNLPTLNDSDISESVTEKQEYAAKPDMYFDENPVIDEEYEVEEGLRSKMKDEGLNSGTCDTGQLGKITNSFASFVILLMIRLW